MEAGRIGQIVRAHKRDIVSFLREIIRIPSLSGQEQEAAQRVKQEMERSKFDEVFVDGIGNVVGRIGSGRVKILYDAHIDTVDIGDRRNWKYDPFQAVYKDGIIYGRGACDDKASVAATLFAGKLIADLERKKDYTLYISASVEEESAGGRGIEYLIENDGVRPDFVVLAEPTGLRLIRGHKGRVGLKITVRGKSAHAGTPWLGKNAIYEIVPLIHKIQALGRKLSYVPPLGRGTITVTKIECDKASLNAVPDSCAIYVDRRTTLEETETSVKREVKSLVGKKGRVEVLQKFFPAWELPAQNRLLISAQKAYKDLFAVGPKTSLWPFCSNGSYTMGRRKIPTVIFGPGEERFTHCADEQVKVEQVLKAVMFLAILPSYIVGRK